MNGKNIKVGDRVRWESGGGVAEGDVLRVARESGRVGDFVYQAAADDPRYIVETDTGRRAAHKPEALMPA
jgi:hypothetical protein